MMNDLEKLSRDLLIFKLSCLVFILLEIVAAKQQAPNKKFLTKR